MIRQVSGSAKFPISFLDNTSIILSWVKTTNCVHTNFAAPTSTGSWPGTATVRCHLVCATYIKYEQSMTTARTHNGSCCCDQNKEWVKITIFISAENVTAHNTVLCTKYKINKYFLYFDYSAPNSINAANNAMPSPLPARLP